MGQRLSIIAVGRITVKRGWLWVELQADSPWVELTCGPRASYNSSCGRLPKPESLRQDGRYENRHCSTALARRQSSSLFVSTDGQACARDFARDRRRIRRAGADAQAFRPLLVPVAGLRARLRLALEWRDHGRLRSTERGLEADLQGHGPVHRGWQGGDVSQDAERDRGAGAGAARTARRPRLREPAERESSTTTPCRTATRSTITASSSTAWAGGRSFSKA